jgi:hypothetical protein
MARKPTETIALSLRVREELRRRLEREAKKQNHSLNAEIVHRLQRSLERDQGIEVEEAIHGQLASMPKEQIGPALVALAGIGGPLGRLASMAAIATEEGRAAALERLAWMQPQKEGK